MCCFPTKSRNGKCAALRAGNWGMVRNTIEKMSLALAACRNGSIGWGAPAKAGGMTTEADKLSTRFPASQFLRQPRR